MQPSATFNFQLSNTKDINDLETCQYEKSQIVRTLFFLSVVVVVELVFCFIFVCLNVSSLTLIVGCLQF